MDLKLVKKLLDLIAESDAEEVTVEEGEFKLKVKKTSDTSAQIPYPMPPYPVQPAGAPSQPASVPQPEKNAAGNPGPEAASDQDPQGEVIKSPIIGTFYEAPSPDSDPYVQVGDNVTAGQTLCIIEAMKIMNEIEAEFSGTIEKILIEDGSPVEFDQPLFIIKKS